MYRTTTLLATAIAALTVTATPAAAQDDDQRWSGFYVGGSVGIPAQPNDRGESVEFDTNRDGIFGDTVRNTTGANVFSPGFCNGRANANNAAAGCISDSDNEEYFIRAGMDRQMGNLVVGVVVEGGRSNVRDSVTAFTTTPANYSFTREIDYALNARGRFGYARGNGLFYVTGGISYAQIENSFQTSNTANSFTPTNANNRVLGGSAGGGAEVMLNRNFTIGLEYLYTRYNDDDYVITAGRGTQAATHPFVLVNANGTDFRRSDPQFDMHAVRATVAFRF